MMGAKRMRTSRQQLIEEPATLADRTANGAGAEAEPARELALEEAANRFDRIADIINRNLYHQQEKIKDAQYIAAEGSAAIRSLSSPDHADAGKVEGDGWLPIESAPTNKAIQIFIPNADYYGNEGVYAGMLVDMGTGRRWMTFGWSVSRDTGPDMLPTHWRPLPSAPSEGAE
ncbi:hypothetical protein [Brucella intermedia]|uniref:hypothetical protein n=1 Tax=Brucella intermedia TaxID=94625 RepID=UPI0013855C3D|nr:hypothetical protein [Brucella intermedia]KAB2709677.1 DUF551 domain-containing protein [Brucella intermedia]